MMRVLLLADINSSHTQKWATGLAQRGHSVGIFSISQPVADWYSGCNIVLLNPSFKNKFASNSIFKISYLKLLPELKQAIAQFKPELIHAHYATSYGLLGALSGFHPYIISAWGSDVMDFPNRSFAHKALVKYNLKKADLILATSETIVKALAPLSSKSIQTIPFGVDTGLFKVSAVKAPFPEGSIVVGTVKSLEPVYGIDILIRAFKKASDKDERLKLLIVGSGTKMEEYKKLVSDLSIAHKVIFSNKVEHSKVVNYYNMIDIFVNVSHNESFGVSVLEASACEKPVIVSNTGGLKELVTEGYNGVLVEPGNVAATAVAIEKLANDKALCMKLGANGRLLVQEKYNFTTNLNDLLMIYERISKNPIKNKT